MYLEDIKFCIIDIETTGINSRSDEIIAFACVPMINLKIVVHNSFYTLITPGNYQIEAMKYHGISKDDLKSAPAFEDVAERILESLDGILVGYSVAFDYTFLRRYFKALGINLKRELLDIAMIERWLGQKLGTDDLDLSFEAMMAGYGLKQYFRHNASADAFFAAQIFQMQIRKLQVLGIDSAEKVIRLAKSCRYADHGFAF
jgi:DNA polymerase III epsilon subunit family exonuclease